MKFDKDNQQIARDYALLLLQMRNYDMHLEVKNSMLASRPSFRANWTALAIAHHLVGNYDMAIQVLDTFEDACRVLSSFLYSFL